MISLDKLKKNSFCFCRVSKYRILEKHLCFFSHIFYEKNLIGSKSKKFFFYDLEDGQEFSISGDVERLYSGHIDRTLGSLFMVEEIL